jgi:uncharacterized membrane protein
MSERERTAWVWLLCLLVAPAAYFVAAAQLVKPGLDGGFDLARLRLLAVPLTFMALVAIGVRLVNWKISGRWGTVVPDERDQRIEIKASALAYYVLMTGMIVVGFVMPFTASQWELIDAAFFFIVLAEITHCVLVIHAYRRGIRD